MMKAVFEKRGLTLVPIDDAGVSMLKKHPDGKRLIISAYSPRNEKQFRLLMGLIGKIIDAGAWKGDVDSMRDWLQISMGRVRTVIDPETAKVFLVPISMSAEDLGDPEFREFFDKAIQIICEKLLDRADWAWLKDEIIEACERRNYGGVR
jgi:hypothetical protein